jgi:hypothetical protein
MKYRRDLVIIMIFLSLTFISRIQHELLSIIYCEMAIKTIVSNYVRYHRLRYHQLLKKGIFSELYALQAGHVSGSIEGSISEQTLLISNL